KEAVLMRQLDDIKNMLEDLNVAGERCEKALLVSQTD
ncbi:MerR family transcriptional regulator, partial [Vibrio sp. M260118]